ncbi:MAG TPA: aminotransferase class I/II-fold pyridoxal phosphate-dependent enzyme [Oligoflexia bacterium]|nr:aminotransferase class I/II-fold pyridoxal phosphate-dependent enzyme [Oligoflexia bacterium]HMP27014.1 aminotransferase class I/II-fold pyridoxal phosphate-dependent enzyme [Oligoflexia bacterium]
MVIADFLERTAGVYKRFSQIKLELVQAGREVLDLSMINTDLPPPRVLIDKLVEASIRPNNHRYSASRGIRKIRSDFAAKYRRDFQVDLDPDSEICVALGTKDGLNCFLAVASQPGESILLARPFYPMHCSTALLHKLRPVFYDIGGSEAETIANIERSLNSEKVSLAITSFPGNPISFQFSPKFVGEVAKILTSRGIKVFNDFTYASMTFNGASTASMLAYSRSGVIESFSLSKSFSIAGWRIAALLGDQELAQKIADYKSLVDYGNFTPLQVAASYALSPQLDKFPQETSGIYKRRGDVLKELLLRCGFEVSPFAAGCSLWAKFPTGIDSTAFAERLLSEFEIHISPGELYGDSERCYGRFALVHSEQKLMRLEGALQVLLTEHDRAV